MVDKIVDHLANGGDPQETCGVVGACPKCWFFGLNAINEFIRVFGLLPKEDLN